MNEINEVKKIVTDLENYTRKWLSESLFDTEKEPRKTVCYTKEEKKIIHIMDEIEKLKRSIEKNKYFGM